MEEKHPQKHLLTGAATANPRNYTAPMLVAIGGQLVVRQPRK